MLDEVDAFCHHPARVIQLAFALLAYLTLLPAAPARHAREQGVVVDAGGPHYAAPVLVDAHDHAAAPAIAPALDAPAWRGAADAPLIGVISVARLWLRTQRLLC